MNAPNKATGPFQKTGRQKVSRRHKYDPNRFHSATQRFTAATATTGGSQ